MSIFGQEIDPNDDYYDGDYKCAACKKLVYSTVINSLCKVYITASVVIGAMVDKI